ncbi:sensor histidine kinase [Desulforhopalus singaporensis]|nr:ATP-binding protein [Desulforhopalus singaporensis]
MSRSRPRIKIYFISVLVFAVLLSGGLTVIAKWTYWKGVDDILERGNVRLDLYVNYLKGTLEKYESLPELLAIDDKLLHALLNPHEKTRIATLNKYLETINKVSDTLDTYLLNKDGLTIAASNWNEPRPFIGRNFSYRPYFKEAMKGHLGRYFALGTTSAKRGYYFAYPVYKNKEIAGAVVIKIGVDLVERKWAQEEESYLVTDPDGVIFITTNTSWRYKTLHPLADQVLERIRETKRYPHEQFAPLSDKILTVSPDYQVLEIAKESGGGARRFIKQSQYMPQAGWHVHILTETKGLKRKVLAVSVIAGSGFMVLYIIAMLLYQRQYRLEELNRIEQKAREALRDANEQLETRVHDRTKKLTEANILLKKEILDRKKAEIKLKRTRRELVHAAKLAVLGQMSAGINHELNQPLAAIRSYADNAKKFLEKDRLEEVCYNLDQIAELTERMAQIGVQLKLFSRKSGDRIVVVTLQSVVDGALEILNPAIKKAKVDMTISIVPQNVKVKGNHVLLQQVLVNLVTNAIQALEEQEQKRITIDCRVTDDRVRISVQDNGPGVLPKELKNIFEPFFTTKKSGQGLGLGLTISSRIVKSFGGTLEYIEQPDGARFEFSLEQVV